MRDGLTEEVGAEEPINEDMIGEPPNRSRQPERMHRRGIFRIPQVNRTERSAVPLELPDRAHRQSSFRMCIQFSQQNFDELGLPDIVDGRPHEIVASGVIDEADKVVKSRQGRVMSRVDDPIVVAGMAFDDLASPVGGAVVRDDDFEVPVRLGTERSEGPIQEMSTV